MKKTFSLWVLVGVITFTSVAAAEVELDFGAFIENDLRLAVDRVDEPTFDRNTTTLGTDIKAGLVPSRLRFVGSLKFSWVGFTRDAEFSTLSGREAVSPYYLESDSAYIEVLDVLPGLDLRMGRQIVQFGAADMFNPTNNLNALDLEDPLMFGETIANQMIRADWYIGDTDFILTGVWVPLFQPAMMPPSASIAVANPDSEFPFVNPEIRQDAERLRNLYLRNPEYYDILTPNATADMPEFSLANSQAAVRLQFVVGSFDMSLSYYIGRDTIPVPVDSLSLGETTGESASDGTPILQVGTEVRLVYPKKQVLGFDMAGQIPFLDDAGFWFEGALIFPEQVTMRFDITDIVLGAQVIEGDVVQSTPFFKFVVGTDYTINSYLFLTAQFLRGFVDEFGVDALNNYAVGALDIKMLQEKMTLRFSGIYEFPHKDDDRNLDDDGDGLVESFAPGATQDGTISSMVFFPSLILKPLDGLEMTLGGYFLFGHPESKFAMPAAGPSLVFFKAKASF